MVEFHWLIGMFREIRGDKLTEETSVKGITVYKWYSHSIYSKTHVHKLEITDLHYTVRWEAATCKWEKCIS